jgi:hypothetical protein
MCLHDEENRIENDNDQVDLERSMLISNPEMWKELYGKDLMPDGPGMQLWQPTTEDEFEEMIKAWEGDDYTPPDVSNAPDVMPEGYSHLLRDGG